MVKFCYIFHLNFKNQVIKKSNYSMKCFNDRLKVSRPQFGNTVFFILNIVRQAHK